MPMGQGMGMMGGCPMMGGNMGMGMMGGTDNATMMGKMPMDMMQSMMQMMMDRMPESPTQ